MQADPWLSGDMRSSHASANFADPVKAACQGLAAGVDRTGAENQGVVMSASGAHEGAGVLVARTNFDVCAALFEG